MQYLDARRKPIRYGFLSIVLVVASAVTSLDASTGRADILSYFRLSTELTRARFRGTLIPELRKCPQKQISTLDENRSVRESIASNVEGGLELGLLLIQCLDGGELLDMERALSSFSIEHPREFLRGAEMAGLVPFRVASIAIVASERAIDDIDERIRELDHRQRVFSTLRRGDESVYVNAILTRVGIEKRRLGETETYRPHL